MTGLAIEGLRGGYRRGVDAIRGVTMSVAAGDVVSILGVNGAGKTTLLRLIAGLLRATSGSIVFADEAIERLSVPARVRRGVTLVPQGQQLFGQMSVYENLRLGAYARGHEQARTRSSLALVTSIFPALQARMSQRASSLSGGERAMVAIGRGLMSNPRLLLLDEPSAGLAPGVRVRLFAQIRDLARARGMTVVLAEQDVDNAMDVATGAYVLQSGEVAAQADATTGASEIFRALTGVTPSGTVTPIGSDRQTLVGEQSHVE